MSKHWQSFGELNNSDAFQQSVKDEFKEELPFEADDKGLLAAKEMVLQGSLSAQCQSLYQHLYLK